MSRRDNNDYLHTLIAVILIAAWVLTTFAVLTCTRARGDDTTQRPEVLRMGDGCSGVQVGPELALTARHCCDDLDDDRLTTFRSPDGGSSLALRLAEIGAADGPAVFRTARRSQWIPLSDAPPSVGSAITLWGHRDDMRASGKVLGVETVSVRIGDERRAVEQNRTSAVARPGFSGGPAIVDGERTLSGLVLSGDDRSTGITTWRSMRDTVDAAERLLQSQPVCTVYVTRRCAACDQFKRDLERGAYVKLPVSFVLVYIDQQIVPGVDVAPTFELNGQRWTPQKYDGHEIAGWIRGQLQSGVVVVSPPQPTYPSPKDLYPVSQVAGPQYGGELPAMPDPMPAPAQQAAPVVAIPWHGIRIIAIASEDCPVYAPYLAGPFNRVLSYASGGQTQLETVSEISEPLRFRAVTQAAGIYELRPALYVVVLVDAVAEVGFVKGMVLQQIERAVDEAVKGEQLKIPVDAVFARVHRHNYDAITRAMLVADQPRPGAVMLPDTATTAAPPEPADDQSNPIAFICGLLGVTGARRVWKFYADVWRTAEAEKQLQMTETLRSAGAATQPAAAPAAAPATRPAAAPAAAPK